MKAFTLPQLWATQALTRCETMPQTLRIPPWLPKSGVPTTADPVWHELLAGEVIDQTGRVKDEYAEQMQVLSNPDIEVSVSITRWHDDDTLREMVAALVRQGSTWVGATTHGWAAKPNESGTALAGNNGARPEQAESTAPEELPPEVVLSTLGDMGRDTALNTLTDVILGLAGELEPADIEPVHGRRDELLAAVGSALGGAGLSDLFGLGMSPHQAEVIAAAGNPMAPMLTVGVVEYPEQTCGHTVLCLIDTEYGRVMSTTEFLGGHWSDKIETWLTIAPPDRTRVRAELATLLERSSAGTQWDHRRAM